MSNLLVLPGDPLFDLTLATSPPPGSFQDERVAFVVSSDSGILRPVNSAEMTEYIEGGEYDERLQSIGEDDEFLDGDIY